MGSDYLPTSVPPGPVGTERGGEGRRGRKTPSVPDPVAVALETLVNVPFVSAGTRPGSVQAD